MKHIFVDGIVYPLRMLIKSHIANIARLENNIFTKILFQRIIHIFDFRKCMLMMCWFVLVVSRAQGRLLTLVSAK